MFEPVVLGVDPGLAALGVAAVARGNGRPRLLWATTVRTPAGLGDAARLRLVFEALDAALAEHRPEAVAVERLMWGRNSGSAMGVARATGVVMLAAALRGIPLEEYAPLEVKLSVAGSGDATKDQVRRALERLVGMAAVPAAPDAADAVAVAVCHLTQSRLRGLVRRS